MMFNKRNSSHNNVDILLGDPKSAIVKLSIPMMTAMVIQTLYTVVDRIWVSGLGSDAIAAVGFTFPLLFMGNALAAGVGIGVNSAISRRIGANNKDDADLTAAHSVIILVILSLIYALPLFIFATDIFIIIGTGRTLDLAVIYARIMYTATPVGFFVFIANAILRAEGDAKRAMTSMILGSLLNVILDPLFIYTFNLGVAGAAYATVLSMGVSALLLFYWLLLKQDTYVSIRLKEFKFKTYIIKDILTVGLPASVMQLSMSIMLFLMNIIVNHVNGIDGVAVFSAGWSIATIASTPLLGMATGVVSVTGALYGAERYNDIHTAHIYAIKIGLLVEIIIALATFIFAPYITLAFTHSPDMARLEEDIILFMRIICLYYPATAFGLLSTSVFQGIGKGLNSLIVTVLRTILLIVPLAWLFSVTLNLGLVGAWIGLVSSNIIGAGITYAWVSIHIKRLMRSKMK
ncbi:MAG: MATE family efflux transporter [Candidatus Thermoplasmatota archaeon]